MKGSLPQEEWREMGEMVIYTFGGGEILWKIYNGLALLFQSDSLYLTGVVKLTIAIGAIWACIRATLGHNVWIFAKSWFVPTFLLLNVFFLPKTSIHIIDKIDASQRYVQVDHVPLGAALVASLASQISLFLVEKIEEVFISPNAPRYSETGGMMAARLADEARNVRISDPVMRDNLKNFVSRCYVWPFLYGNVGGLEKEARKSGDILGFIKAHPHPSNGVYWKEEADKTHFKVCRECVPLAQAALEQETRVSLTRLAQSLFSSDRAADPNSQQVSAKLTRYFPHAWETLAGHTQQAHTILAQNLMLNTTRESMDDGRESFGHTRLWENLLSSHAARIQEHQGLMELIRGSVAGTWLPTLQTILFSLLIMLFVLVAPLCFLPKGFEMLILWCQLTLWVQLWPVFSCLLYCLGSLFATRAGFAIMSEAGGALNLESQNALGDAARHAYTWISGLQLTVPFLSWAFLSRSGYAISNLAGSVTQSLDNGANRAASEMVEGNISFDNQTMHNQSVANAQYGRQDMGPKFDFAQTLDTGSLNKIVNPMSGDATYQERLSSLKTSFAMEDNMTTELSKASSEAQNIALSKEAALGQSLSTVEQKGLSFLEGVASGKITNESWTKEQQEHYAKAAQTFTHAAHTHQKDQIASRGSGVSGEMGVRSNDSLVGKIGSVLFGLSGGVSASVNASSHTTAQELNSYGTHDQNLHDVGDLLQKAHQTGWTSTESVDVHEAREFRQAMDHAQNLSEQTHVAYTQARNLEVAARVAESQGLHVRSDVTDEVLKFVADQSYGGSLDQAVRMASDNPEAFKAAASPYLQERKAALIQSIAGQRGNLTESDIKSQFENWNTREMAPHKEKLSAQYATHGTADVTSVEAQTGQAKRHIQSQEASKEGSWRVKNPEAQTYQTFEELRQGLEKGVGQGVEAGKEMTGHVGRELQKSHLRRAAEQVGGDIAGYLPELKREPVLKSPPEPFEPL